MHSGSPGGVLLGSVNLSPQVAAGPDGKKGSQWKTVSAPLTGSKGMTDVYFVFRNDEVKDKNLMILDWIQFSK